MPQMENLPGYPSREEMQAELGSHRVAEFLLIGGIGLGAAIGAEAVMPDAIPERIAYWQEAEALNAAEGVGDVCFVTEEGTSVVISFKTTDEWCVETAADVLDVSTDEVIMTGTAAPAELDAQVEAEETEREEDIEAAEDDVRRKLALAAGISASVLTALGIHGFKNILVQNMQGKENSVLNEASTKRKREKDIAAFKESWAKKTNAEKQESDELTFRQKMNTFEKMRKMGVPARRVKKLEQEFYEWWFTRPIDYEPKGKVAERRELWGMYVASREASQEERRLRGEERQIQGGRARRVARAFRPRWRSGEEPGQFITPDHEAAYAPRPTSPGLSSMFVSPEGERYSDLRVAAHTGRATRMSQAGTIDQNLQDRKVMGQQRTVRPTKDLADFDPMAEQDEAIVE